MSAALNVFSVAAISLGVFFFLAGTVGLLRFPDTLTRLHALTKADNLGLGLTMLGLLPHVAWPFGALKLAAGYGGERGCVTACGTRGSEQTTRWS
jgi:multicomponent Na+:H+ antiporter subunit G